MVQKDEKGQKGARGLRPTSVNITFPFSEKQICFPKTNTFIKVLYSGWHKQKRKTQ